jgi:hypothetical protein
MDWMKGEPLIFDEDGGLSIEEWDVASLSWLLDNRTVLDEYGIDQVAFEEFVSNNTEHRLFSVDTF